MEFDPNAGRFRDLDVVLGAVTGENVEIGSADPLNYHQAISDPGGCPARTIDGKLFLPPGDGVVPLVRVVPGSLGVGPNHVAHAETLLGTGVAVFVLDPFGPRAVESTVANQTQYSFAASAFDVAATLAVLADHPRVDAGRISAQGHSRGGSAVICAADRRFADAAVGPDVGFAGVYAVYPWCGHQFAHPAIGSTVRAIVGERDDWVSVQQVQAQVQAIRLAGGDASVRVVGGAAHSFDRLETPHKLEDASVAPGAPTVYLADDGAMIDPLTGESDPALTDRDAFIAAMEAGFGRRGATIGGIDDQPETFRADMLAFHTKLFTLR
ncbi:MAG: dienelactone hydrolase family protein [Ilumatobacteraceae bacterium]